MQSNPMDKQITTDTPLGLDAQLTSQVKSEAKKVLKASKSEETITTLVERVQKVAMKRQPSLDSYLSLETYFGQVSEALGIVSKYSDATSLSNPVIMNEDLMHLSALHTNLSEMVGYLQGISSRTEDSRKVMKSRYAMSIKEERDKVLRDGKSVKLTETDVDNASRILSEDAYLAARDVEVVSRMISASWYAIGDFTKILSSAITRTYKELDNDRLR